jgi:hypothetical protein
MLVVKLSNEQQFLDLLSTVESDDQKFKYTEFSLDSWQQAFGYKLDNRHEFIKPPAKKPKLYPCIMVCNHLHGSRIRHEFIYAKDFETSEFKIVLEA